MTVDDKEYAKLLEEMAELRRENDLLKEVIDRIPLQVMITDEGGRILMGNAKAASFLGISGKNMAAVSFSKPSEPGLFQERKMPVVGEVRLNHCHLDGEDRYIQQTCRPLQAFEETLWMYLGEDITHFKEVENGLKIRENRIKAILDNAVEGIITINEGGLVETFNPAAANIFGYTTSEVVGRNIKMLMPEPYHGDHDNYISQFLKTGVPKIIGRGREVMGRRKNGAVFPMHLAVSVVPLPQSMLFTGIVRDLSEYKDMQDEVARAQHLALVGEMAATIAHEIRNPLAGISGALQIICSSMGDDDPHAEILGEVYSQVVRLSKSVNDLLMFTKKWDPTRENYAVADLVNRVIRTLSLEADFRAISFDIQIPERTYAFLDPMLVEQILWNLFQNARDAMSNKGLIKVIAVTEEKFVNLTIEDNGPGMDPDLLSKIFKPFFTTKTQGTGLGLPITKRIMEAHGGDVRITSEVGKGASIVLHFPKPPLN